MARWRDGDSQRYGTSATRKRRWHYLLGGLQEKEKQGLRTYKVKHPFWSFDATGTLVGTGVILETVRLNQSGNQYTGSFEFINYDLKGNVTSDTKGDLKAERITVD